MPLKPEEVLANIAKREAAPFITTINQKLEEATEIPVIVMVPQHVSQVAMDEIAKEFFPAGWDLSFSNYFNEEGMPISKFTLAIKPVTSVSAPEESSAANNTTITEMNDKLNEVLKT